MAKILVGISGSISAYKAIDFVNGLVKTGNEVKVIMTNSSREFISQINFFNAETFVDEDEWNNKEILHIRLAKWADAFVIYPATANTIAKLVYGIADNLLLTTWLACTEKKIIFPAMNTEMLKNKTTRANMDALNMMKNVEVMSTEEGILACGDVGPGKVIKPRNAVIAVNQKINHKASKKTILVTSGGTKAPIDGVRVVTNISSGALGATIINDLLQNTGYNIIHIAPKMSIHSEVSKIFPYRYRYYRADTVDEVYTAMESYVPEADAVIHSMAISDFTFDIEKMGKLKSSDPDGFIEAMKQSIKLSPKIIAKIKKWNPSTILVGFKFEVGANTAELDELARKQIEECGSDFVLVNDKTEMNAAKEHVARLLYEPHGDCIKQKMCKGKSQIAVTIREQIIEKI